MIYKAFVCVKISRLYRVFTYIYLLSSERENICDRRNLSFRVLMCACRPGISSFFGKSFRFLFLFLSYILKVDNATIFKYNDQK
jgi:hypothetical protein